MTEWFDTAEKRPLRDDGAGPEHRVWVQTTTGDFFGVSYMSVREQPKLYPYWQRITPPEPKKSRVEGAKESCKRWEVDSDEWYNRIEDLIRAIVEEGKS